MVFKNDARQERNVQYWHVEPTKNDHGDDSNLMDKAELRQQMYARMARGSALAEAEENARRKRRGQ